MMNIPTSTWPKLKAGLLACTVLCFATSSLAEEVTLKSIGGSVSLTGDLVEFTDGDYIVKSQFGVLRVEAALVECTGGGCPIIQASDDTVVEWDVSLWGKRRAFTEHVEKLAQLVSEGTDGKFTLNLSYGGLSGSRENLDGIAAGAFEMAQFCAGYHPEKNPSITVLELPFLGVTSLEQEVDLSLAVYDHPTTVADMARWNATLLMPSPLPQSNIMGVGSLPTSLQAFNGMTIRAAGGIGHAVEALGAVPVLLPAPDVKDALEDGSVQAAAFAPHSHMAFGTLDSGSWWTSNLNPGTTNCPVVMNTTALQRLPSLHREVLMSSVDEALDHYLDNYNGATMAAWQPALLERGIIEITIHDEIVAAINEQVARPAAADWIAETSAKGLPAQELYDLVSNLIAGQS